MQIDLVVYANNYPLHEYAAKVTVSDIYAECWEPLKTTDEPLIAYATGEKLAGGRSCEIVRKLREGAAEELAEHLAKMIIASMEKRDTHNGYKKGERDG